MIELFLEVSRRCAAGERVALCTVVSARGSTPQHRGARMMVTAAGELLGTLGGGCVEAEVKQRALRQLLAADVNAEVSVEVNSDASADVSADARAASPSILSFRLDHDHGWDDGMWCGGILDVHVQLLHGPADAAQFAKLADALRDERAATISIPEVGFEETLSPSPRLLIAGAGHIAQALAALANRLDFGVTVIDDRADVLTSPRFPGTKRIIGTIDLELLRQRIDANTYIVLVTRGHHRDAAALAAVIDTSAKYIGMIGSKRKVRTILGVMAEQGVDREKLLRVRAPIGLEIGAISVEEIAVSIAAELIATRRGETQNAGDAMKLSRAELDAWIDRKNLERIS